MEETTPDILENAPENEEIQSEPVASEPVASEPAQPEPKKRGRPAGAKDKAPRKKIKIVAEPLAPHEEEVSEEPEQPSQPSQSLQPEPVPPSPRTLHRQAAELILHLNNQRSEARRAQMRDMYTKNLAIY